MKATIAFLLAAFAITAVTALSGCESPRTADTTQPHAEPQSWEANMAGMSGMGTSNR
jgi:hypothetical protein